MSPREDGFTLVETLMALILVTGVLIALGQTMSGGWRGIAAAEREKLAMAVARNVLAEAGTAVPLEPGVREGIAPQGLAYTLRVTPHAPNGASQRPKGGLDGYWVTVEVRLPSAASGRERTVVLTTFKLGSGQ